MAGPTTASPKGKGKTEAEEPAFKNYNDEINPMDSVNLWSYLTWSWVKDLVDRGYDRQLRSTDLYALSLQDDSSHIHEKLRIAWEHQLTTPNPSIWGALTTVWWKPYGSFGIWALLESWLKLSQAFFLGLLVGEFENEVVDVKQASIYAGGLFLCAASISITHHRYFFHVMRASGQMGVGIISLCFGKALNVHLTSFSKMPPGKIFNMIASDVRMLARPAVFSHFLWVGVQEIVIIMYLLYRDLGVYSFVGLALICLTIPLQGLFMQRFTVYREHAAKFGDERVKSMKEIIFGIDVIKMNAYEQPYKQSVTESRDAEVGILYQAARLKAANQSFFYLSPLVIAFGTFVTFSLGGNTFSSQVVFTALSLYYVLLKTITLFIPYALEGVSQAKVSFKRIDTFLMNAEHPDRYVHENTNNNTSSSSKQQQSEDALELPTILTLETPETANTEPHVTVENVTAKWTEADQDNLRPTLDHISFASKEDNKLIAVVGSFGSGKTSLLMLLLNELSATSGQVSVSGKTTYCPQVGWIQTGTVRSNITMGSPYDPVRFRKAVSAACLDVDIRGWIDGEMTEIGERGITLSGGQRARISLARCVYSNADIYLLDDPLSAVDTKVGKLLMERCMYGALKGKIVVLVTHQLHFLKNVDEILLMHEGKILTKGTYDDIASSEFASVLTHKPLDTKSNSTEEGGGGVEALLDDHAEDTSGSRNGSRNSSLTAAEAPGLRETKRQASVERRKRNSTQEKKQAESKARQLIRAEDRTAGVVTKDTYLDYFLASKNGSSVYVVILTLLMLMMELCRIFANWWLARWVQRQSTLGDNGNLFYIYGLTISVSVCCLITVISLTFAYFTFLSASRGLHDRMLASILRAPLAFFQANPVGRVLNRFAGDIGIMDDELPATISEVWSLTFNLMGTIVFVCVVNPYVFIGVLPLCGIFYWIRDKYVRTARETKRLEAVAKSPVHSHFSETLDGLIVVRGFKAQSAFTKELYHRMDASSRAFMSSLTLMRWLGCRLDFLSAVFIGITAFLSIIAAKQGLTDPAFLGVSLIFALRLMGSFQWYTRLTVEVENFMTSVERVVAYCKLEPEAPLTLEALRVEASNAVSIADVEAPTVTAPGQRRRLVPLTSNLRPSWPERGAIEIRDLSFTYHPDLPLALKNINVNIRAGSKVGIVGRTGSGKSSLMSCFFRLFEFAEGDIFIDNVPISRIGLFELREKLGIIPQVPFLFTGTIRRNLDPFKKFSDAQLWQVLESVQLAEHVRGMKPKAPVEGEESAASSTQLSGLDGHVAEGGRNLSVGSQQLLCLARALAKKAKIFIMDESTANIDKKTDGIIQDILTQQLQTQTVLVIAHRINTIIDSDQVLVLDNGRLVEAGSPYELLCKEESHFKNLVQHTGKETAAELFEIAKQKAHSSEDHAADDEEATSPVVITI